MFAVSNELGLDWEFLRYREGERRKIAYACEGIIFKSIGIYGKVFKLLGWGRKIKMYF